MEKLFDMNNILNKYRNNSYDKYMNENIQYIEYRNNSIFKKFTVNSFVLSTVNMIDNLLSNPFKDILKKMK